MRLPGGLEIQESMRAADGLRKRSPIGTRRKSRACEPGFSVANRDYLTGPGGGSGRVGDPALTLLLTFRPRATVWLWLLCGGSTFTAPALTFVLTFRPRETVWLCCGPWLPALRLVLTFRLRAAVWLWLKPPPPAFTFVLIFICPSPLGC